MQFLFQKTQFGLAPLADDAKEWLFKKKLGATIMVEPKEMRNGAFFRKWWALVNVGFDYWGDAAETIEYKGQKVEPEFERFRKDVTITAGFYYPVVNLKGEVRIEAESLKWSSMTEERFTKLYEATSKVLLAKVFNGTLCTKWTKAQLDDVVNQIMAFT